MKIKGKKLSSTELQMTIPKMMKAHLKKQYNARQIIDKLKIENSKDSVQDALDKLTQKGIILSFEGEKYGILPLSPADTSSEKILLNTTIEGKKSIEKIKEIAKEANKNFDKTLNKDIKKEEKKGEKSGRSDRMNAIGTVDMTKNGTAYIICKELEMDVFINGKNLQNALHGDSVKIQFWYPRGRLKPDGEVVEVIERASDFFIGTIRFTKRYAIMIPDRLNMPVDVYIDLEDASTAKEGDKVIVKIMKWHSKTIKSPIGKVTNVLGKSGSNDLEMKSILINHGFNIEFPEEVIEESEAIDTVISEAEIARRRDMRSTTTFTIDPVDAKDFDDAISYRKLDNGNYEIGIHIADVAHYIQPNTQLDREALRRSTSVYLADRVCPMLPEKISNELCSLRPHEDKLTFSAVFEINDNGAVENRWFGRTVTHSNRRFTYEEAQDIIETKEGDYAEEILKVNDLSRALRKKRFKNGAIDFDTEEVRFRLDEEGVPVDVYIKQRKDSNMLIEDLMLLANKEVATFVAKKVVPEIPMIYRIHDLPNQEKLMEFALFAAGQGFKFDFSTPKSIAASFNTIVKAAETNPEYKLFAPIAVRTMAKAAYSTYNIGHYGLAFDYYSHFTSPIRRYSDVLAHRVLFDNLGEKIKRYDQTRLEEMCNHISKQERKAMEAERESTKYKQVEFMKSRLGQVFDGIVSGMLDKGIFVETVEAKCEGLISFAQFDEAFEILNGRLLAKGRRTGKSYRLGDPVRVRIVGADLAKRQIEMEIVLDEE